MLRQHLECPPPSCHLTAPPAAGREQTLSSTPEGPLLLQVPPSAPCVEALPTSTHLRERQGDGN